MIAKNEWIFNLKSKFTIVCIAFLSLANAQKEEYRHTRFRVYLHPISTFLYTSPKVFYGSWAFEFYPTWALDGQVGHESGEYTRERMLVSGEDFTIRKKKHYQCGFVFGSRIS